MSCRLIRLPLGLLVVILVAGCGLRGEEPASDPETTTPVAPAPPATTPADTTDVEGEAPLRVKISDEERERLASQASSDLAAARGIAALRPDLDTLGADERQDWESLDHYIELAESFLDDEDVRAAADVALKARLLAAELHPD
jgi:hypothetical protein